MGNNVLELETSAPSSDLGMESNGQLQGGNGRLKRRRESGSSDDTNSAATTCTRLEIHTAETTPEHDVVDEEEEL